MRTIYKYAVILAIEAAAFFAAFGILILLTKADGIDMIVISMFASLMVSLAVYFKYFDNEGENDGRTHK